MHKIRYFLLFLVCNDYLSRQYCFLIILTKFEVNSKATAKFLQDLLICLEMTLAAFAHSFAFSYNEFTDYSKINKNIYTSFTSVLNMKDIISDAESTFIIQDEENDTQMEDIKLSQSSNEEIVKML